MIYTREFAGKVFTRHVQQDASEFLSHPCNESVVLQNILINQLIQTIRCPGCD